MIKPLKALSKLWETNQDKLDGINKFKISIPFKTIKITLRKLKDYISPLLK